MVNLCISPHRENGAPFSTDFSDSGPLGDEPYRPESPGGLMKCPRCRERTPDAWERVIISVASSPYTKAFDLVPFEGAERRTLQLDWMYCANEECRQLVVRGNESSFRRDPSGDPIPSVRTDTWIAYPRHSARALDPLVAEEAPDLAADFAEASSILEISPRMSAVLSRSILADLLERYANLTAYGVAERVDKFRGDDKHPSALREHMHHFREIADFGAHTQRNDQDEIIEVDLAAATWMLDYLERLFDYLIVGPAKDREIARQWDKNLEDAERRPIKPLPLETDGEAHSEDAKGSGDSSPKAS